MPTVIPATQSLGVINLNGQLSDVPAFSGRWFIRSCVINPNPGNRRRSWILRRIAIAVLGVVSLSEKAQSQGNQRAEPIAALMGQLNSSDPKTREEASFRIAQIGSGAVPVLISALSDGRILTREMAAKTLGRMGTVAAPASRALGDLLFDSAVVVRATVAQALWNMGLGAHQAIPAMARALGNTAVDQDLALAQALRVHGPAAYPAVPGLIHVLEGPGAWEKQHAALTLGAIGPAAKSAVPALTKALDDPDAEVRANAAIALGGIRQVSYDAVRNMIKLLDDYSPDVQSAAVDALGSIGRRAGPDGARAIASYAKNKNVDRRRDAILALEKLGPSSRTALPLLIASLRDTDWEIRKAAIGAIDSIGPLAQEAAPGVSRLVADGLVHDAARHALARIGPIGDSLLFVQIQRGEIDPGVIKTYQGLGTNAVPQLLLALGSGNPATRVTAARALGAISDSSGRTFPALRARLGDREVAVRIAVVDAFARVGHRALPPLLAALKSDTPSVRASAAEALGKVNDSSKQVMRPLVQALGDPDAKVRISAALALASLGEIDSEILAPLTDAVLSDRPDVRQTAALVAKRVALAKQDSRDVRGLGVLRRLRNELRTSEDAEVRAQYEEVRRAVDFLESIWWQKQVDRAQAWADKHRPFLAGLSLEFVLLIVCLVVFSVRPLFLLRLNERLRRYSDVSLPDWLGGMTIPIRHVLIIGFFQYRSRVLDAWVKSHADAARREFGRKVTVLERRIHIPIPVAVDAEVIPTPSVQDFRPLFQKARALILIRGEGGAGKTSLACQLGWWALEEDGENRLHPRHMMLPVLIEHDFAAGDGEKGLVIESVVRGQLAAMLGSDQPISAELFHELLRRQRLLVMLDHLSEMTDETRHVVRFDAAEMAVNAFVVTSRLLETLHGVPRVEVNPLRIRGDRLSSFMEAYLSRRGKRDLFDDTEYFEACRRLSEMVGEADATPLLAKLYAEQMIWVKEGSPEARLPDTIPDLILSYLNEINRAADSGDPQDRDVHRIARILGWHCVYPSFRPRIARREDVLREFRTTGINEDVLGYFEEKLRLIQSVGPAKDEIRFSLDPVAEYLAALYVTEEFAADENRWRKLIAELDAVPGSPESVRGFVVALRNCVVARGSSRRTPAWVGDALAVRAGLDPEILRHTKLRQRIRRLMYNLALPDVEDRIAAARLLGKVGADAKEAIGALAEAARSSDPDLRHAAREALLSIEGNRAEINPSGATA